MVQILEKEIWSSEKTRSQMVCYLFCYHLRPIADILRIKRYFWITFFSEIQRVFKVSNRMLDRRLTQ